MARFVYAGDFCDRLATLAKAKNMQQLSAWLKLAANECHLGNLRMHEPAQLVGVWDWDVGNNRTYADEVCGGFFGHAAKAAAGGLPLEQFTDRIYPDDIAQFRANLQNAMRHGGIFQADYRVIANDKARWVRAQGNCTVDGAGKPLRALGSIIDITRR